MIEINLASLAITLALVGIGITLALTAATNELRGIKEELREARKRCITTKSDWTV